ncbi:MAG TPA: response regulator transcription factor [Gammaproteobacteria bacterium]|nr:response regulator transcription factor [Gammaproteobacteria bacterium]HET7588067.1 response regulator transcription factor [Gammaproteobacteria bacterium]
MQILVIEDDREAAAYLAKGLAESGHLPELVHDGAEGLRRALAETFDVIIVDRMLPGMDGLSIVAELRSRDKATPILILSALSDTDERVSGLRAGGDDYLVKPFAFSELLARVEALGRRQRPELVEKVLAVGDLRLDRIKRAVSRNGQRIQLQPREFRLLEFLMMRADQVVTRTMLLEHVWDYHFDPQTNVIDVHISRLRNKIDKDFDPPLLHTVRGAGYSLRTP